MHGIEDVVRRAVHYAGNRAYRIATQDTLKVHEPRYSAADRRGAAEGNAVFLCKGDKLFIIMCDKVLVCGDEVLARTHCGAGVLVCGGKPAHRLDHGVDLLIIYNNVKVAHGTVAEFGLCPAHENVFKLHVAALVDDLQNAAADYAAAQQCNFHIVSPPFK